MHEGSGEFSSLENEKQVEKPVRIFAHRAGWVNSELREKLDKESGKESVPGQYESNSIPRAVETFKNKGIDGVEVDIRLTKDGIPVVVHDDVSGLTLKKFHGKYPYHATLESWLDWLENDPSMKEKTIYLDIKDKSIDMYKLIELTEKLGERIQLGSYDPQIIYKALLARKILGAKTKIYLQVPDPIKPSVSVNYANKLVENIGLKKLLDHGTDEEKELVNDLKPDGLHVCFLSPLHTVIAAEIAGHHEFVSVTDKPKKETARVIPNIPGFYNLQELRTKSFVRLAKKEGYEVFGGTITSSNDLERMMGWGFDEILTNDPDALPQSLKKQIEEVEEEKDKDLNITNDSAVQTITPDISSDISATGSYKYGPRNLLLHKPDISIVEGDLLKEYNSGQGNDRRRTYLLYSMMTKSPNIIRKSVGI